MVEVWKDIEGYEGLYQVSNLGRVWSITNDRELRQYFHTNGYKYLALSKNANAKRAYIHRLVAYAFLDSTNYKKYDKNDNTKIEVNHIDEDKTNNCVNNLEFVTHRYNLKYGTRNERCIELGKKANPCKKVYQYDLNYNLIKVWESVNEIHRQLGYSLGNLNSCVHNSYCKQKNVYKNYIWSYKPLEGRF